MGFFFVQNFFFRTTRELEYFFLVVNWSSLLQRTDFFSFLLWRWKTWGCQLTFIELKQTSHLPDVCRFRLFLWQFGGFFRKPLEDFPLSSIFNTAVLYIVHVHRHRWYLGLLDWIVCSCPGRYSPLQSLLMFGAEFSPRSVVLSPVCTTL